MSLFQAKELIEKILFEPDFMGSILAIEDPVDRIAFVNEMGFSCTADEIRLLQNNLEDKIISASDCRCNRLIATYKCGNYR
jgi:predicted ribosomally synthesized peptide with nif11-like leader